MKSSEQKAIDLLEHLIDYLDGQILSGKPTDKQIEQAINLLKNNNIMVESAPTERPTSILKGLPKFEAIK